MPIVGPPSNSCMLGCGCDLYGQGCVCVRVCVPQHVSRPPGSVRQDGTGCVNCAYWGCLESVCVSLPVCLLRAQLCPRGCVAQGGVCLRVGAGGVWECVCVSRHDVCACWVCAYACMCGGGSRRRVSGRVSLLFRQSPGEDMKFKKKINFHSTCADCVKGRGYWVRDEGAVEGGRGPRQLPRQPEQLREIKTTG